MNIRKKLSPKDNAIVKKVTYNTAAGILKTIVKMADQEGLTDIHQVNDWIQSLTVDEFCDYKFVEASYPDLIEGE